MCVSKWKILEDNLCITLIASLVQMRWTHIFFCLPGIYKTYTDKSLNIYICDMYFK